MDNKLMRVPYFAGALAFLASLAPGVHADIYKFVDKDGHTFFTDRPNHQGYKLVVKTWKAWIPTRTLNVASLYNTRRRYEPEIARVAMQYQLPNALIHAVVTAESAYNPHAVSPAGAVGLMQLMRGTAERYGVYDRTDPVANLHAGSRYLRDLLIMFNNNLALAVAAYNAGENAVIRYGNKIPPYQETQTYVKRVLHYYDRYRAFM
jgi:soluble lytic murein transglycosylase-like protein